MFATTFGTRYVVFFLLPLLAFVAFPLAFSQLLIAAWHFSFLELYGVFLVYLFWVVLFLYPAIRTQTEWLVYAGSMVVAFGLAAFGFVVAQGLDSFIKLH